MTSRTGLVAASQAWPEVHPRLTNLACTSARFTVLATACARRSGVSFSAPASEPITARSTEASRTNLFMLGSLAAFRKQFFNQRGARLQILLRAPLRPLDTALLGRDSQFVVLDPQD